MKNILPKNLIDLIFGYCFNCGQDKNCYVFRTNRNHLPQKIIYIEFGQKINQIIFEDTFPKSLIKLILGYEFNQPIHSFSNNLIE